MIETKRFFLRELTSADAGERYLGWLKDPETSRFIVAARSTPDLDALRHYIEQREHRRDVLFLGIFNRVDGAHIGNIKFEPIDEDAGSTTMGILIGEREWRGRGVATEVLLATAQWLFDCRRITRIALGVERSNFAAVKAYLKAGFRILDGVERQVSTDGALWMERKHSRAHRIALGTIQFGQAYGVANKTGQVGTQEASDILHRSWAAGLDTIDTAIAYGESEQRLGSIGVANWQIVSKLPGVPHGMDDIQAWVRQSVSGSLQRLGVTRLYGLLLHRPRELMGPLGKQLIAALHELKHQGLVGKVGVSIYDPSELTSIQKYGPFDLVQAPFNVLDRRLLSTGWLQRMADDGTEVHTRSVFLQGLLLMNPAERPPRFSQWSLLWRDYDSWLQKSGVTALTACLSFALSFAEIGRVVVGVDTRAQLDDILAAADAPSAYVPVSGAVQSSDLDLIDPSRWTAF